MLRERHPLLVGTLTGADGALPANRVALRQLGAWGMLALLLAVFAILKYRWIVYSASDENIYFYMGKLVSEGYLPYRDFRFAHPPVRLLPPALVFAVFGFNFTALKMLPVVATGVTALFLFLTVRRTVSPLHALVGVAVFLFSLAGQFYTSYYLGTNLTVTFLVIGLYLLVRDRPALAGAVFGVALLTGVYAGVALLLLGAYYLITDRRRLLPLLIGGLAVFLPVNIAAFIVGGADYFRFVYLFHFLKTSDVITPKADTLTGIFLLNPVFLCAALLYPLARRKATDIFWLIGLGFCGFIAAYMSIHDYYFLLAAPFLAVSAAMTLLHLLGRLRLPPAWLGMVAAALITVFAVVHSGRAWTGISLSAVPQAPDMARLARDLTPEGESVFGISELAPLVALLADRDLLHREADTNAKVFLTGVADLEPVGRELAGGRRVVLVVKERQAGPGVMIQYGPMVDEKFRDYVHGNCRMIQAWSNVNDPDVTIVLLLNGRAPSGKGPPR